MKASFRRAMTAVLLISSLAMPTTSHAWFFFFIPGGLFSNNDKKTVTELQQKQDWNSLHQLAETRLSNNEDDPVWLNIDAYALQKLNRCSEAIPKFKKSLEFKADNSSAENNLGNCQLTMNQLDDAVATFTNLISKSPDYWQAYYNLGVTYVRKSDPANARIYLDQLNARNMVMAKQLEDSQIKPLESRIEQARIAAANRETEEKDRVERERLAKEEADAKAKAEAETAAKAKAEAEEKIRAEAAAEKERIAQIEATKTPPKSLEVRLKELKQLYGKGLITNAVYDARQKELLKQH